MSGRRLLPCALPSAVADILCQGLHAGSGVRAHGGAAGDDGAERSVVVADDMLPVRL